MFITCPSGLQVEVRGLKGSEARILTDKNLAKRAGVSDEILSKCTVSLVNSGPYTFQGQADWKQALIGDRMYTLIKIREATFGPNYDVDFVCPNSSCQERIPWNLRLDRMVIRNLDGTLPDEHVPDSIVVHQLVPTVAEVFRTTNKFETVVPSEGRKLFFKLRNGEDEVKAQRAAMALANKMQVNRSQQRSNTTEILDLSEGDLLMIAIMNSLVEIEGVAQPKWREYLNDLPLGDIPLILEAFEAVDCGVEPFVEITCTSCGVGGEARIPFGPKFWFPTQRRK